MSLHFVECVYVDLAYMDFFSFAHIRVAVLGINRLSFINVLCDLDTDNTSR